MLTRTDCFILSRSSKSAQEMPRYSLRILVHGFSRNTFVLLEAKEIVLALLQNAAFVGLIQMKYLFISTIHSITLTKLNRSSHAKNKIYSSEKMQHNSTKGSTAAPVFRSPNNICRSSKRIDVLVLIR